jgi:hypothetical protein
MELSQRILCGAFPGSELLAFSFLSWHSRRNNEKKLVEQTKAKKFFNKCCFEGKDESNVGGLTMLVGNFGLKIC